MLRKDFFQLTQRYDNLKGQFAQVTSRLSWKTVSKFIDGVVKIPGMLHIVRFERRVVRRLRLRKVKAVIEKSGLFDADYYLSMNPVVRGNGINPLIHYINHGGFEGRWPNPVFDSARYLESFPELALIGMNPLYHCILHGQKNGNKIQCHLEPAVEVAERVDQLFESSTLLDPIFALDEVTILGCLDLLDTSKVT